MKYLASLFFVLAQTWPGQTAGPALDPVQIDEWPVPYKMNQAREILDGFPESRRENTRPRDPSVDPQGRVWFCGQAGNYIAYLEPETGSFKRYALEEGTHPHNLIIDKDGYVWYAGNRNSHIGKLDPKTGDIRKFMMPDPAVRDPHTLVFDSHGDIWFTAQQSNAVGKLTVATGKIQLIHVPTPRARPYGIKLDSKDRPWIVLFGTNKIFTVDPNTMESREITLPREGTRPRRLEVTSDDKLWYVDYAEGYLGRFDPVTGAVDEWPAPGGREARPYGMAMDDKDRLWFVEGTRPNHFVGFDSKTLDFFSNTDIPSGGGTVRHMYYHKPTREIWFGTDANTVGRARVP